MAFTTDQILALTTTQVAALTTDQIVGLSTADIQVLSAPQIQALSVDQVQALTTVQVTAFYQAQIADLTTAQMSCLTWAQLNALQNAGTALPLVLNSMPGSPTANTYALIYEANTYHSMRGQNAAWWAATENQQAQCLVWATRLLDQQLWKGVKAVKPGALRWPQIGQIDMDWLIVDPTSIPQFLKNACAEWAFWLLQEDRTADEGGLTQYGGKTGPIFDPKMYVRKAMPDAVLDICRPYLLNPSSVYASVRRV